MPMHPPAPLPQALSNPRIHPADPSIRFEVLPRDLSAYRVGNTGVPYAFRFDSGKPGPHVAINALTHGNEFCGMTAVCALLDAGVRPERGVLSLSFANVAAYQSFNIDSPFDARMLVHNLNRIWSAVQLNGTERSPDLDRAREMRPVFDRVDSLLDIHSTSQAVEPFFVAGESTVNRALANGIGFPPLQMWMPGGMSTGTPLIEYAQFGQADSTHSGALVVECGQHFAHASGVMATQVALSFLAHHGTLSRTQAGALCEAFTGHNPLEQPFTAPRAYKMLSVHVIRTPELRWTRPLVGMEVFAKGELIGTDGELEIRSPCDNCTIFMPLGINRVAVPGREGIYLTQPV